MRARGRWSSGTGGRRREEEEELAGSGRDGDVGARPASAEVGGGETGRVLRRRDGADRAGGARDGGGRGRSGRGEGGGGHGGRRPAEVLELGAASWCTMGRGSGGGAGGERRQAPDGGRGEKKGKNKEMITGERGKKRRGKRKKGRWEDPIAKHKKQRRVAARC